jgi:hypothetical protein
MHCVGRMQSFNLLKQMGGLKGLMKNQEPTRSQLGIQSTALWSSRKLQNGKAWICPSEHQREARARGQRTVPHALQIGHSKLAPAATLLGGDCPNLGIRRHAGIVPHIIQLHPFQSIIQYTAWVTEGVIK